MQLRCVKCGWNADEPDPAIVARGTCPECDGQLWSGEPRSSAILPEAVAMVFESGSKIARQAAPHYRQLDLATGKQTQNDSQAFPVELLASPPVVTPDGVTTGVFELPALPDLNFESDSAEPEVDEPHVAEPTLLVAPVVVTGPATQPVADVEDSTEPVVSDAPAVVEDEESEQLPSLPVMARAEPVRQSRGVGAGLSNTPLFIDTRVSSLVPLVVSAVLALVMVVGGVFFHRELAQPWVAEEAALELSAEQQALDLYSRALDDYVLGHLELAHEKLQRALAENPELAPAHTLLGSLLARKGQRGSALRAYLRGRELGGLERDQRVEALLERALELAHLEEAVPSEGEVDWERVARLLEQTQGSRAPLSPSSANP